MVPKIKEEYLICTLLLIFYFELLKSPSDIALHFIFSQWHHYYISIVLLLPAVDHSQPWALAVDRNDERRRGG